MKLYEYQAKELFGKQGIPVPEGIPCRSEEEAAGAFTRLSGRTGEVVLKSQVLAGGRGKAGGVRPARSRDEAREIFRTLMGLTIKGLRPAAVLVEERLPVEKEYYLGITVDPASCRPALLVSSRGGIEVEGIARESPSALADCLISRGRGLPSHEILGIIQRLGIDRGLSLAMITAAKQLFELFGRYEATLAEINPLAKTADGRLVALDARLSIDDNALFRHPELEPYKKELIDHRRIDLKEAGIDFVYTGGNVGLICAGAGMTMATMDLVDAMGGKAACFCDVSAGINPRSMELAMRTVSSLDGVRSMLINMFGGLTRMDEVARSFLAARDSMGGLGLPLVIRLEGTNVEEGRKIMEEQGFQTYTDLYDAVARAVELAREDEHPRGQ